MPEAEPEPGPGFLVAYSGLPGNLPKDYHNTVFLWQGALPNTTAEPLEEQDVPTNLERGEVKFEKSLTAAAYCVTYQVGADASRMCALAQINPGSGNAPDPPPAVVIEIDQLTDKSVTVMYTTLPGYEPHAHQNWVGLWPGYALPYTAPKPAARADVMSDYTQGLVTLDATFVPAFTYTIAYFMGPEQSTAAALIYFQPARPPLRPI
ncbi:MAG TPA: hypothetical protein VMD91_04440 [Candidatus Sulfotelmatobacter sp.]|nr:hypothetical protein [Candidatus Sulfotelmatobacter sp.]